VFHATPDHVLYEQTLLLAVHHERTCCCVLLWQHQMRPLETSQMRNYIILRVSRIELSLGIQRCRDVHWRMGGTYCFHFQVRIEWLRNKQEESSNIWGFHSGDYKEWRLLGCYAVWFFQEPQGVTSQKTLFFNKRAEFGCFLASLVYSSTFNL
jgi:hypothetical protein